MTKQKKQIMLDNIFIILFITILLNFSKGFLRHHQIFESFFVLK